ncbi:FUSC family protein [Micromonospora eburnea]|uniref:Fusaric acid resistance protein-like n=1 Tax=Micromonospora eburnea TaxID=227316 RepID=A0A1C6V7W2_9ACTN|nr:FUSC family protein [Micromonospora eburnea]SCL62408.1 Fusaric acid resistance protein-like [Micromonospora eburnea]
MREQMRVMLRQVLHVRPAGAAHRVALRAGISVLVPLLAVLALDHPGWSVYAVFGAFTSLYGRNHVHLSRMAMQASAGMALTLSTVLGVLVGSLESRAWVAVPVTAAVAALGSALAAAQDWHPPGPLFLVFAFGAVASAPRALPDVPIAVVVAGLSSLFALLVGNVGSVLRRQRSRPARLAHGWTGEPVRYALAVVLAGGTVTAVGIGHPYWAMVAAVAPLTVQGMTAQLVRAAHRVLGTLLGLLTSAVLLAPHLSPYATVLVVAGLQIVTELLVGRNYGLALLFITPMALLMGQLAAPRPAGQLLFDRGVETLIGTGIGGLIVLGEPWLRARISAGRGPQR